MDPLLQARCAFAAAHPGSHGAPEDARAFLTELAAPGGILDLSAGNERAVLGALIESCDNAADSAVLVLLGVRRPASEALLTAALRWALGRAALGPRRCLDVAGPEEGPFSAALLCAGGFAEAYRMLTLERPALPPPGDEPPPTGLVFASCEAHHVPSLHQATALAFAGIPGALVPPLEPFRERTLSRRIPPRLLLDGERVAGFVRVEPGTDGPGMVAILGRHPAYARRGLGAVLLREGLRLLGRRGPGPVRLEVAAANEIAQQLYRDAGFALVRSVSTWRAPLSKRPQ